MTVKNNDIERKMSFSGMTFAKMLYLCGMKHKIYVASSWRNEHYPEIVAKFWLVLLVGLLSVLRMSGQTNPVFKLVKESGHFYFTASVNGVKAKLMFESGVPGFMMGHAFYEAHKDSLKMEVKPCDEKIRYLGGIHHVKQSASHARLRIGDAIFDGPVKIVEDDDKLRFPIQMLHHASDSSSIVWMDLEKSVFSVISRESLQGLVKKAQTMDLSFNKWDMPMVKTTLTLKVNGRQTSIEGHFIADMGNASLLFLNKSQTNVVKMMENGWIVLKEARNKEGKVVAEGFYADRVTICDRNFKGVSVGVNPFKSMDEYGIVGLKFFNIPTIFDFGERKLYLCK